MDLEQLVEAARAAGAAGESWNRWAMSDAIQDAFMKADLGPLEQESIEQAFEAGAREIAISKARIVWTTAPKDYDWADAIDLGVVGDWHGKPLRKVAIAPEAYDAQTARYESGLHGAFDKDPIEEDKRWREEQAARDAERAAREAKHQAAIEWLRTATAEELANEDLTWERGATYQDVRAERKRRAEIAEDEQRGADWARVSAAIPDGVTLIDEGAYIVPPMVGLRPISRPPKVYYDVRVVHGWPDDVEHAHLEQASGRRGRATMNLSISIALEMLAKGELRIAAEGEVPPYAVVERIGAENWKKIRRVEAGGRTVWVGRATFGAENLVLDAEGKLVRAKKIVDAALAAAAEQSEGEGHARSRGPRRAVGALARRYGRSMRSRGNVRVLGHSTDVTKCEHCGKGGLAETVMLSVDGSPPVYYGADCASALLKTG